MRLHVGFVRLAAAIAMAAFAHMAGAQVLWQNFSAGMAIDEVHRAAPNAELLADDPQHKLATGGMLKLRVPNIEIVGTQFNAEFFFADDRLTDVHLVHKSKQDIAAGRRIYDDLATALRSKYGNELRRESSRNLGWSGTTTWSMSGTTVNLLAFLYNDSTFIQIGYSAQLAKEASKL